MKTLSQFATDLRRLPRVVAIKVAAAAAKPLTDVAKETFDKGETPYGVDWAPGAKGQKVTLKKSGALESKIHYVAIGTRLRVALGVAYAKYQVGKRPVFPRAGGELPDSYVAVLERTAAKVCKEELR